MPRCDEKVILSYCQFPTPLKCVHAIVKSIRQLLELSFGETKFGGANLGMIIANSIFFHSKSLPFGVAFFLSLTGLGDTIRHV